MKLWKKYIAIVCLTAAAAGCGDEDPTVEIDSVSAWGNEFYLREKVKVWMAVKTNDLPAARYTWTCQGGAFTQPQSLDENTWQAPREPGVYTITCTVDVDGVKKTRSRQMNVLPIYYFDHFEKLPLSFGVYASSSTVTQVIDQATKNGYIETRPTGSNTTRGVIQRAFADQELKAPFSTKAAIAWTSNFPTGVINTGSAPNVVTTQNTMYYEWALARDPDKLDNEYIDNVTFEWYPRGRTGGLPTDTGLPGGTQYNGVLRLRVRNITTGTVTFVSTYVNNTALAFNQNQLKTLSLSIDASYRMFVHVAGTEVINTGMLQTWRAASNGGAGSKDDMYVDSWRFAFASATGSNVSVIRYDDAIAYHDGTVVK
jgi:hypothetical protein